MPGWSAGVKLVFSWLQFRMFDDWRQRSGVGAARDRTHKFFAFVRTNVFPALGRSREKVFPENERKKFRGSNRRAAPAPLRCRPLGAS